MEGHEVSAEGSGDIAIIGEGTPNRAAVSIQVLQSIYHELTGKTEDISKSYDDSFRIVYKDFEQLNHRVNQACEQYNIRANTYSIKVFYVNDTQKSFSSFERFQSFCSGLSSSVESVLITYNFLIVLPKVGHAQSYTLNIRVASKVAIQNKLKGQMFFEMPKIIRMMGGRTAVVTIKYVDYAVARNMLHIVDEWFNTLAKSKPSKYWNFFRKRTSYIPLISRYLISLSVAIIVFIYLPEFITPQSNLLDFSRFLLCATIGIFASYKLAHHLGSAAEDSIDEWSDLAYISITDGDRTEIENAIKSNRSSIRSAIIKLFGAVALSVLAKIIVSWLV